jgi:uncharacterized protein YuzE
MYPDNKGQKVDIKYDKANDVLYISFGPPRPSYCAAEKDDVFIMKDIQTGDYSGITILDFSERLNDGSLYSIRLPFEFDFKLLDRELGKN